MKTTAEWTAKGVAAATGVATTAVSALTKQSLDAYASYEQLKGGVETLFGAGGQNIYEYAEAQGKAVEDIKDEYQSLMRAQVTVMQNAKDAYMNAGMSTNEYMETVTSFSASLIQSLDGDTKAAASAADMAIRDMSDNANKMGTDMSLIQNAYNGFAKGNFTMLDNLKLGYGGTKEEMARLIEDASKMTDIQEKLGIKVEEGNDSFANIANAIHVVQANMGILGTTEREAATTIEGSTKMMKASWENLVTGIADENANMGDLVDDFINSALTVFDNVEPRIEEILNGIIRLVNNGLPKILEIIPPLLQEHLPTLINAAAQMVQSVLNSISQNLPVFITVINDLLTQLVNLIITNLPLVIDAGLQIILGLADGIAQSLPELIPVIIEVINKIVDSLVEHTPELLEAALQIMLALANGLVDNLPKIMEKAPKIIAELAAGLVKAAPQLLAAAAKLLIKLAEGLIKSIGYVKKAVPDIINAIKERFTNFDWGSIGHNIIEGIKNGLVNKAKDLVNTVKETAQGVIDSFKDVLKIHSPSKVFEYMGDMCVAGFEEPLEDLSLDNVTAGVTASVSSMQAGIAGANYENSGSFIGNMNSNVQVILEGDAAGVFRLVRQENRKMTRAVGYNMLTT